MTLYERYKQLNIDFAQLDLEPGPERGDYFCTPEGARVIGWAGVDGIHYCFVDGFEDMVFAVSPCSLPGEYVHPLARSFEDFLRLLLAAGGGAALEQAWMWNRGEFDAFLETYPPSEEARAALDAIAQELSLTPMEDPYGYIRQVQREFDYSGIPWGPEYDGCVSEAPKPPERPEWKVYYGGDSALNHAGRDKPGAEIPVGAKFEWAGHTWHVPAVYACGQGLVVELCMEVDPEAFAAFRVKWLPWFEGGREFTPEEQDQMRAEDPQTVEYEPTLTLNGKELKRRSGTGFGWMPASLREVCGQEGLFQQDWEAIWLMEHYGLDPERGWMFFRESFPWATKRRPALRSLSLRMSQYPKPVPGPRFSVQGPGDEVSFTHPVTGQAHTLRVLEYEEQEMDTALLDDDWEYPTHYMAMSCVVEPDLPKGELAIQDCGQGDRPRAKRLPDSSKPAAACAIGIIGGSDGPAVILMGGKTGCPRTAFSALSFDRPGRVEWRMTFRQKTEEDMDAALPLPRG